MKMRPGGRSLSLRRPYATEKIPQVMGVDAATIRLVDPSGKNLLLVAASGLSREYLHRGPVNSEESVTMAMAGSPVAIYDAATDPRVIYPKQAQKEGVKSILVAPIVYRGKVRGVLRLLTRVPRRFEKREIDFVTALDEQGGIAIQNATNYRKIMDLVTELEQHEEFLQKILDSLNADLFVIEMASAVAHELNNLLSIVLITAELLRRDLFRSGQSTEDLESMIKNLNRMPDLIRKMTHITQYKAKKYVSGTTIIDLDGTG